MTELPVIPSFGKGDLVAEFWASGRPVSQGSKTMYTRNGKSWFAESNAAFLNKWRSWVTACTRRSWEGILKCAKREIHAVLSERESNGQRTGYWLEVDFVFHTPKSKPKWWPLYLSDPDGDKLFRAIGDAVTKSEAWVDDNRCCVGRFTKSYGKEEGALVRLWEVTCDATD